MKARALKVQIFMILTAALLVPGPLVPALYGQAPGAPCPGGFTCNFEEGNLRGWTSTGTAFGNQPTLGDNPTARNRGQPSNHQGRWWIGTYENYQGRPGQAPGQVQDDGPRGTLTSPRFVIPSGILTFLIGGGSDPATRVELMVHDPIDGVDTRALQATGSNTETMHRVRWDLAPYAGKTGFIRIVDDSSSGWGHINVDDFQFMGNLGVLNGAQTATPPGGVTAIPPPDNEKPQPPTAHIEPSFQRVPAGQSVTFRSLSEAGPGAAMRRISWKGPGDQTATGPEFSIDTQGLSPGYYEITLLVLNTRGQTARAAARLEVTTQLPPLTARIHPEYVSVKQGGQATFKNMSPVEPHTTLTRQDWSGPGNQRGQGNSFTVSTDGLAPGMHNVRLSIADSRGRRAVATARLEVTVREIDVSLIASKTVVRANEEVEFTALSNVQDQRPEYLFRFGDEQPSGWMQAASAQHGFTHPGTYEVQVRLRLAGRTATSNVVTITVEEEPQPPVAEIDPPSTTVAKGEAAEFHSRSTPAGGVRETWSGPDNQQGTGPDFAIATNDLEPGTYTVTLVVEDDHHRVARAEAYVFVAEGPAAPPPPTPQPPPPVGIMLGVEPNPAKAGAEVRLFASTHGQPEGAAYQFSVDGTVIRDWSPDPGTEYIFRNKGTYTATASMRAGDALLLQSGPVEIRIGAAIPPSVYVVLVLLAATGAYGFIRSHRHGKGLQERNLFMQAIPRPDAGTQAIEVAVPTGALPAVSVRPVPDRGEQTIDIDDLLIR